MLKRKRLTRKAKTAKEFDANSFDGETSSDDETLSIKVAALTPVFDMIVDEGNIIQSTQETNKTIGNNFEPASGSVNVHESNKVMVDKIGVQVCLICLTTNPPLTSIPAPLHHTYTLLSDTSPLPLSTPLLCTSCRRRLCNVERFRRICAKGAAMLARFGGELTQSNIESVDRKLHNIDLVELTITHFEPNTYTYEYIYDEDHKRTKTNLDSEINDKIKLEIESLSPNNDFYDNNDTYDDPIDIENKEMNVQDDVDEITEEVAKTPETVKRKATKSKVKDKIAKLAKPKAKLAKAKAKLAKPKAKLAKTPNLKANAEMKRRKTENDKVKTEVQKKMDEYFAVTIFKTIEEKIEELQKRRENSSYINAPLKCEHCYQGYLDNETYDLHMHKHTDNYGGFICVVCQYRCPSKERLRQHLYFRHSRKFNCKVCSFESHDKYRATLHMKFHEGKTYRCKHCDKVFNHIVNLHNHLRAKHPSDNVCNLCGYSFIGERGLRTHRSLSHGHDLRADGCVIPDDSPACTECDVRFISEDALQMHLKVSPKHGKTVENFKKRNYHQLHRSIQRDEKRGADGVREKEKEKGVARRRDGIRTGKREIRLTKFDDPVPCEKCGTNILSPSEYHYHFKRSHPNEKRTWYPTGSHPHLCDICGKMLRNNALKDHMLEHEEGISFKCDVCSKRFTKRFNMKLHARVHLGERYPCEVCGKLFNHMGNRDRHLKYVHTESKDFKCECCGKCFKNDGARKLHTAHVHQRKPYPKRNRQREKRPADAFEAPWE